MCSFEVNITESLDEIMSLNFLDTQSSGTYLLDIRVVDMMLDRESFFLW